MFALLVDANFATALTRAPAAFDYSDLSAAWGMLKKSSVKNAVISSDFFARIINSPGFYQRTGTGNEGGGGFKAYGWDEIHPCSRWSAAQANVSGFFANPQSLGLVSGLPMRGSSPTLQTKIVRFPGLELSVALNTWFSLSTRTMWGSFDCMFGATPLDKAEGFLLKSA